MLSKSTFPFRFVLSQKKNKLKQNTKLQKFDEHEKSKSNNGILFKD